METSSERTFQFVRLHSLNVGPYIIVANQKQNTFTALLAYVTRQGHKDSEHHWDTISYIKDKLTKNNQEFLIERMYKMHDKSYYLIYPPQSKKSLNQLLVDHNQMSVLEKSSKYYHDNVLKSDNSGRLAVVSLLQDNQKLIKPQWTSRFIELKDTVLDDAGFVKT